MLGEDRNGRNIENMVLTPPETLAITSSDGALLEQHRKVQTYGVNAKRGGGCVDMFFIFKFNIKGLIGCNR